MFYGVSPSIIFFCEHLRVVLANNPTVTASFALPSHFLSLAHLLLSPECHLLNLNFSLITAWGRILTNRGKLS